MDKQHERIKRNRRRTESRNTNRFTENDTKKTSNWKTLGHDRIHGFWFKKFSTIHEGLALEMHRCLQEHTYPNG